MSKKKKEPIRLIALKSGVSTGGGYCYRMDVAAARSVDEVKTAVEKQLETGIDVITWWTPKDGESAAALIRLLRRDPTVTEVLSSMVWSFMSTDDGTFR
jgi:hypothetical protein